jgi:NADPH2:quinone reductase
VKALVCREFAPLSSLRIEEWPEPAAAPGEVVVDVAAASVNYPDALIVQGKYQALPERPFVPGAECAGRIRAVGAGVGDLRVGQPVLALPMRGAFAERVAVPAGAVFALDSRLPLAAAAAIPMTYGTVYHALADRAHLARGETLLVLGAGGGIGTAAVELGKLLGATVVAAASSPAKLALAREAGADHTIDYGAEDLRARLTEFTAGRGVDVVCDPVGGALTELAFRSTTWGGRFLVIGFASGEIPRIGLNLPLLKGSAIVGVFWGEFRRRDPAKARAELEWLLAQAAAGSIAPRITARHTLGDAVRALAAVYERRAAGKVLIEP